MNIEITSYHEYMGKSPMRKTKQGILNYNYYYYFF